jgi:hypothetical protein
MVEQWYAGCWSGCHAFGCQVKYNSWVPLS